MTKYLTLILLLTCGIGRAQNGHTTGIMLCPNGTKIERPCFTIQSPQSNPKSNGYIGDNTNDTNFDVRMICFYIGKENMVKLPHVRISPDIRYCDDIKDKMHDESPCVQKRAEQEVQLDQIDFYKGWLEVFRKLAIKEGDYKP